MQELVDEVRKAREALEAKGAFTDANAATHLTLALEALIKYLSLDTELAARASFFSAFKN